MIQPANGVLSCHVTVAAVVELAQVVVVMDPAADSDDILRVNRSKDRKYAFDHAFGPETRQEDLYQHTTQVCTYAVRALVACAAGVQ